MSAFNGRNTTIFIPVADFDKASAILITIGTQFHVTPMLHARNTVALDVHNDEATKVTRVLTHASISWEQGRRT